MAAAPQPEREPLLSVRGLCTWFPVRRRGWPLGPGAVLKAVDGVSLEVFPGEVLGLVGESGCGKSTLVRSIVQLEPPRAGEVRFEGRALHRLPPRELRRVRRRLQMVFQDPYASLNPRKTVFDTLAEPLRVHGLAPRREMAAAVAGLMEKVGLASRTMRKYPHEFSGGQRQRIAIARALALRPAMLLADEPVSALDVSVQAQILNLLRRLRDEAGLTMMLISHDLAVVRQMAGRIAVMYLGRIVEEGPSEAVFSMPRHPYTQALVSAIPLPDPDRERARREQRLALAGDPPSPAAPPVGCPFHPRCPFSVEACAAAVPALRAAGPAQTAACLRVDAPEVLEAARAAAPASAPAMDGK